MCFPGDKSHLSTKHVWNIVSKWDFTGNTVRFGMVLWESFSDAGEGWPLLFPLMHVFRMEKVSVIDFSGFDKEGILLEGERVVAGLVLRVEQSPLG